MNGVTFSPDGKYFVSSSWDQTIQVWNMGTSEMGSIKWLTNKGDLPWPNCSNTSEDGFTDKSRWENDWILNSQSELLFWVPP
jgi:WD40 repeat protein